jgi:hypothetical protein
MNQTRFYTAASLSALEASHTELCVALARVVRQAEREAAEAGEPTPWLKDARRALKNARKAVQP